MRFKRTFLLLVLTALVSGCAVQALPPVAISIPTRQIDYLTEVNVTSPTCARELDQWFGLNIAGTLFDAIETRRENRH